MQTIPRCFGCQEPVEHDPIYEAPCGPDHQRCPSAVFHPICLMRYRDDEQQRVDVVAAYVIRLSDDHCPHGHLPDCEEHECQG